MAETSTGERHEFQAEVNRILDIVVNSLYSKREVFLRELISNASDACDKLRYEAQLDGNLMGDDPDLKITITPDAKTKTLTVADNGIGMNHDELVANLGTIAGSGTAQFAEQLAEAEKDLAKKEKADMSLIGQFGVGFYAVFMAADEVTVISRRAGSDEAWAWTSDGRTGFEIAEAGADTPRGTTITLKLKKDAKEFSETLRVETVVKTYSEHVGMPVWIATDGQSNQVNEAAALWARPKSEISADQYTEFYRHTGHAFDEPWLTLHNKAEGTISYTSLLFIPSMAPFDLFDPARRHGVKLFVRRVFITDECEGLVPAWLRFLKGVVDSEDLPLNVSREVLQNNPVVAKISKALIKRVLNELKKKAKKDTEGYATFWETFGQVLKEGIYEDEGRRQELLKLARFKSTGGDGWVSLDDYIARMKEGQDSIYMLTGDKTEAMRQSPMLEAFKAKDIEVLLLDEPVDEFWTMSTDAYEEKPFVSVSRGDIDLSGIAGGDDKDETKDEEPAGDVAPLVAMIKLALESSVKDVRESKRLTDSACCLVVDEGDMNMRLQKMLRASGQLGAEGERILEINAKHPLIRSLAERAKGDGGSREIEDMAYLLFDQALILEGELPKDPALFARRMSDAMAKAVS
ncbi:MAG: molecular chaperone HtpG [Alphaproteobacteria bacterium]|jgi:molecular chaperone HtpG|nr:molecular chaperone HtpG [Rhodospirillaceae bacterium]MBT6205801.1 molecular chaperone HtpG [Rhodospirillaceae bacterium]MBT7613904.1 molecular chaperone HtpG [Rhodospirillaceae bacterium]MBT7646298.1 molecular chaperone HtpG [Rhodospirillaceae bacterium]MDG2480945.1 molecular chaperone HtpG [Alphaproteobacteria bacterium]